MKYTVLCTVAAFAAASQAGFISEFGNNNSLLMANDIGSFGAPGGSMLVEGSITEGDVDWFSFTLEDDASFSVFSVFGSNNGDGVMQIVTGAGDVIAFDDNTGVGLMPALQIENLTAGTYYIALGGFGDVDSGSVGSDDQADGLLDTGASHTENFTYKLTVGFTIVPAPGATALLGMGGIMMTRRRR